jgi:hypothetical protein
MISQVQTYQPEQTPRRAEFAAWVIAILIGGTWLWVGRAYATGLTTFLGWALFAILLFSALAISLGNWVGRSTMLILAPDYVSFRNGLRNVMLHWDEINELEVHPARWEAKRVDVWGENAHFSFYTHGKVRYNGEVRDNTGFAAGNEILQEIIKSAKMTLKNETNKVYYYARE